MADLPELIVPDAAAWHAWLDAHHREADGVWLVLAKKGASDPTSLTYAQALDEALCYGWIDGQMGRRDEKTYRQRFTPRRPRSVWSKINRDHIARLTAEGRMRPSGLAAVEEARANGRWETAYGRPEEMEVPDDLAAALQANLEAQAMFDILSRQNRFAILYRIQEARRAETRARRIAQFVAMLAHGKTPYPQKRTRSQS